MAALIPRNALFITIDDCGREQFSQYGLSDAGSPGYPATPNIGALATGGITFDHFYTQPFCSPTRCAYHTARYACRTGLGNIIEDNVTNPMLLGEITLPELAKMMSGGSVSCGCIGKWHLGNSQDGDLFAPNLAGWDYFCGTVRNLDVTAGSYYNFDYMVNGELGHNAGTYSTTWITDRAIDWIREQYDNQWLLNVNYHAPHEPYHRPPTDMFNTGTWNCPLTEPTVGTGPEVLPYFKASIEAADLDIGRLIASIPASVLALTTIYLIADNGTAGATIGNETWAGSFGGGAMEEDHAKRTAYDLGIRCPMFVKGAGVASPTNRHVTGMVHSVDIPITILAHMQLGNALNYLSRRGRTVDGISFAGCLQGNVATTNRNEAFSESFNPNVANKGTNGGTRAMYGKRWKLYSKASAWATQSTREFYDRDSDPRELTNLTPAGVLAGLSTAQRAAYDDLNTKATTLLASVEV